MSLEAEANVAILPPVGPITTLTLPDVFGIAHTLFLLHLSSVVPDALLRHYCDCFILRCRLLPDFIGGDTHRDDKLSRNPATLPQTSSWFSVGQFTEAAASVLKLRTQHSCGERPLVPFGCIHPATAPAGVRVPWTIVCRRQHILGSC